MKNLTLTLIILSNFLLLGCSETPSSSNRITQKSMRIATVGDSITQGFGISNPSEFSYPAQLQTLLDEGAVVENFGITRSTLLSTGNYPYTDTAKFIASQNFNPNIVVIMLGTNDMKPENLSEMNRYVNDYKSLIESYKNLASEPIVYICYPPPSYGNLGGITNENIVNVLLPKIQEVSNANNVTLINLYNPLQNKKDLFPDTLHPNQEGAKIIAETILNSIS